MHIQRPLKALLLIFWACASMCSSANAKPAEESPLYEIHAENISTHGLIAAFASAFRINVVTGDELGNPPVHVDERSIAANVLLERIASANGLAVRRHKGIFLVGSACRLGQNPGRESHAAYGEELSMLFQDVTAGAIFRDVFGNTRGRPLDVSVNNLDSVMIHHIWERPEWDHIVAMSMVQGWSIQESEKAGVNIVQIAQIAACATTISHPPVEAITTTIDIGPPCPHESHASLQCRPGEFYPLSQLKALGFFRELPQPELIAIVAAPSKLTYTFRLGARIGPDFGRIKQITKRGIKIRELYIGKDEIWRERTVWLYFPA